MRLGFIGTGLLTEAVVTALCEIESATYEIVLSPRNPAIARHLADRFSCVTVAPDNESVVQGSDVVALALRPSMAEEVLTTLAFSSEQRVVSLMALVPLARVSELVHPASAVRVLSLPIVASHEGSVVLYPDLPWAHELLEPLSELVVVDDEHVLEMIWSATALMATQLELLRSVGGWLERQGVPTALADRYTRRMFAGITSQAATSERSLSQLLIEAQTPGGLNEQALEELRGSGVFQAIESILDTIAHRVVSDGQTR